MIFLKKKRNIEIDDLRVHPLHYPRSYKSKDEFDVIKCT